MPSTPVVPAVDPDRFRQLCGHFVTGVVVVTFRRPDGQPCGMTVNSFTSVSLTPPLVSIAVDHSAAILPLLLEASQFTINILEAGQEHLSRRFASGITDRFDGVAFAEGREGEIILSNVLAHLHCQQWGTLPAGDHTIIIGQVSGGSAARHGRPLLFYRGGYESGD